MSRNKMANSKVNTKKEGWLEPRAFPGYYNRLKMEMAELKKYLDS